MYCILCTLLTVYQIYNRVSVGLVLFVCLYLDVDVHYASYMYVLYIQMCVSV